MNLPLATTDVWALKGDFNAASFLHQLKLILCDGDVIALGIYSPTARLRNTLIALGAEELDAGRIYNVCFGYNRTEHPNGRSFELIMNATNLAALMIEAERTDGQDDKPLFFDHVVAYRRGTPVLPLLSFHDAFYGGELWISALYPEATIKAFAVGLPSNCALQLNPENF